MFILLYGFLHHILNTVEIFKKILLIEFSLFTFYDYFEYFVRFKVQFTKHFGKQCLQRVNDVTQTSYCLF